MCLTPITLKRPRDEWITEKTGFSTTTRVVPCGKCFKCIARRRNGWSFRLHHESLISDSAVMMTLTYGIGQSMKGKTYGEEPPLSFNGCNTLDKTHVQKFIKRLRKHELSNNNSRPLKYYLAGEYGGTFGRPHYHILLFNCSHATLLRSDMVSTKIWKKGYVRIDRCNIGTINYVAGYINKGQWQPEDDYDDRLPQFSLMSKRLGSSYLTDASYEMHYDRMDQSVMHPSGYRMQLPRYYRDQIFTTEEKNDLFEYSQAMREMSWEEFQNHDFKREIMQKKYLIKQDERKQLLTRQTI
jgi:hypothetical protein